MQTTRQAALKGDLQKALAAFKELAEELEGRKQEVEAMQVSIMLSCPHESMCVGIVNSFEIQENGINCGVGMPLSKMHPYVSKHIAARITTFFCSLISIQGSSNRFWLLMISTHHNNY